jgi:hypothetical protein
MYATADDLAAFLRIHDDDEHPYLDGLLASASEAVTAYCGQRFDQAAASATSRVFAAKFCDLLSVHPISSTTDLVIRTDSADDGVFDVTWLAADYQLEPLNQISGSIVDHPYTRIRAVKARMFPVDHRARVEVTARWGWTTVPASIRDATMMHAARLHERRNAPAGIVAGDGFIGRTALGMDPDVKMLLEPFRRAELWT